MRDTYFDDFDDFEISMKIVIVGNGSVGKSSMIQRFCRGLFTNDYKKTIGVDFLERVVTIDSHPVRLMLWDTAGQEEFDAITRTYYRGANACVLACSVTDRDSFIALPKWKNKIFRECGDIPTVLIANKMDLYKSAVVDSTELEEMARTLGIPLFRTSVKEDFNVNCVFTSLAQEYVQAALNQTGQEDEVLSHNTAKDININSGRDYHPTSDKMLLAHVDRPHKHNGIFGLRSSKDIYKRNLKTNVNQSQGLIIPHSKTKPDGAGERTVKNPVILKSASNNTNKSSNRSFSSRKQDGKYGNMFQNGQSILLPFALDNYQQHPVRTQHFRNEAVIHPNYYRQYHYKSVGTPVPLDQSFRFNRRDICSIL